MTEPIPPTLEEIFYRDELMPCCGKPIKVFIGPRVGLFINIRCFHCGTKFNILPGFHFKEKI